MCLEKGYDGNITAIKIIAENEHQALTKAYSYVGGDCRLTSENFNILCNNNDFKTCQKLFEDFTEQSILYFGMASDDLFVDELDIAE